MFLVSNTSITEGGGGGGFEVPRGPISVVYVTQVEGEILKGKHCALPHSAISKNHEKKSCAFLDLFERVDDENKLSADMNVLKEMFHTENRLFGFASQFWLRKMKKLFKFKKN